MDTLKVESKYFTWAIGKIIKRAIKKKTGCKNITIDLKSLIVNFDGEMANVHLDIDGQLPKEAIHKLVFNEDDEE